MSDCSRIFAELWPLANGSRPIYAPVVFCHADFADDADFFSWDFIIGRHGIYSEISCCVDYSRIFADATCPVVADTPEVGKSPTDFTDLHRFFLGCFFVTQISQMTQIFLRGRVLSHRFHRYTQIFYGISGESLCSISGGICNDRTGRIRENP